VTHDQARVFVTHAVRVALHTLMLRLFLKLRSCRGCSRTFTDRTLFITVATYASNFR